jgi:hypothetical protein
MYCAGLVKQKSGKKVPSFIKYSKRWHLLPPFLSNEPSTGVETVDSINEGWDFSEGQRKH